MLAGLLDPFPVGPELARGRRAGAPGALDRPGAARGRSPNSCAGEGTMARPADSSAACSASVTGWLAKYGSRKAASSTSTVSDSQTRRSAWLVPYGGSTPHRCTRTP